MHYAHQKSDQILDSALMHEHVPTARPATKTKSGTIVPCSSAWRHQRQNAWGGREGVGVGSAVPCLRGAAVDMLCVRPTTGKFKSS